MTPKLPDEYVDFRKQQIVEAAWECFSENGYHETTIRDIAKRMNASTGVVYNYFDGKEEVLEAVHDCGRETMAKLMDVAAEKPSAKDAIAELFDIVFQRIPIEDREKNARCAIGFWAEALKKQSHKEIFRSQSEFLLGRITDIIKRGIKNGELRTTVDPKAFADLCIALAMGLQVQSVLAGGLNTPRYYQQLRKILFSNVWRGAEKDSGS